MVWQTGEQPARVYLDLAVNGEEIILPDEPRLPQGASHSEVAATVEAPGDAAQATARRRCRIRRIAGTTS